MWNKQKQQTNVSLMSNLQTYYHFKLDFQKVAQHTGGKWLIQGTKRCKDNQLQSLEWINESMISSMDQAESTDYHEGYPLHCPMTALTSCLDNLYSQYLPACLYCLCQIWVFILTVCLAW